MPKSSTSYQGKVQGDHQFESMEQSQRDEHARKIGEVEAFMDSLEKDKVRLEKEMKRLSGRT